MNKFDLIHPNNKKSPIEAELLPCPFCGNKAELSGCFPNGQYYITCTGCRVSLWYDRKDKAIGAWNRRTKPVSELIEKPVIFKSDSLFEKPCYARNCIYNVYPTCKCRSVGNECKSHESE